MKPLNSTKRWSWFDGFGLAAIALLVLQVCLMQYGRDQGIYAVVSDVILDGGTPYKDVWDLKLPGIFAIYAFSRALFGTSMVSVRIVEALALLSMVAAFVVLSRRLVGDRKLGIAAGVLALFYHVSLGFWSTAQPESFGGPLVVWGLVLATGPGPDSTRKSLRQMYGIWAACAVLFALAAFLKPPLGGGIFLACAAVCLREWRRQSTTPPGHRLAAVVLSFSAGGAFVLGAFALYLTAKSAWADFYEIFFVYIPNYTGIGLSWRGLPALFIRVFEEWPAGLHPFVWLGVLFALFLPQTHAREREGLLLVFGAALFQMIGIATQAKFFPYHYGGLLPLMALVSVWGYAKYCRIWKGPWILIGVLIVGFHYVATQGDTLEKSRLRLVALFDAEKSQEINDRLHIIYDVNAHANRLVAEWIAENTPEDLPIYVWGFEPVIYDQSNRRSASKYIYNIAQRSEWSREEARANLMEELTSAMPSVVVTLTGDDFEHATGNTLDSAEELATFPRLVDFISRHYTRVKRAEDLTVYQRSDLLRGPASGLNAPLPAAGF